MSTIYELIAAGQFFNGSLKMPTTPRPSTIIDHTKPNHTLRNTTKAFSAMSHPTHTITGGLQRYPTLRNEIDELWEEWGKHPASEFHFKALQKDISELAIDIDTGDFVHQTYTDDGEGEVEEVKRQNQEMEGCLCDADEDTEAGLESQIALNECYLRWAEKVAMYHHQEEIYRMYKYRETWIVDAWNCGRTIGNKKHDEFVKGDIVIKVTHEEISVFIFGSVCNSSPQPFIQDINGRVKGFVIARSTPISARPVQYSYIFAHTLATISEIDSYIMESAMRREIPIPTGRPSRKLKLGEELLPSVAPRTVRQRRDDSTLAELTEQPEVERYNGPTLEDLTAQPVVDEE